MDTAIRESQAVAVDNGDLLEAMNAANTWASILRGARHRTSHARRGGDTERYVEAADRIDQAVARLRDQAHKSALGKSVDGGREWV